MFQHEVQENPYGLFVAACFIIHKVQVKCDQAHRIWMNKQTGSQRFLKDAEDIDGIRQKRCFILNIEAVVLHDISRFNFRTSLKNALKEWGFFGVIVFQCSQKDAGQFTDQSGMLEIGLHKVFNASPTTLVFETHPLGHFDLKIKGELICSTISHQVQMTADGPQKFTGFDKVVIFIFAEHAELDQIHWV